MEQQTVDDGLLFLNCSHHHENQFRSAVRISGCPRGTVPRFCFGALFNENIRHSGSRYGDVYTGVGVACSILFCVIGAGTDAENSFYVGNYNVDRLGHDFVKVIHFVQNDICHELGGIRKFSTYKVTNKSVHPVAVIIL